MSSAAAALEVVEAAERRADALAAGNADALRDILHPSFRWTSFAGELFDRESYLEANTGSNGLKWVSQQLEDVAVVVDGDVALLQGVVVDVVQPVDVRETFRLRITQVWTRSGGTWRCLGGHAGPRLPS